MYEIWKNKQKNNLQNSFLSFHGEEFIFAVLCDVFC